MLEPAALKELSLEDDKAVFLVRDGDCFDY
jgi:hypothetical protein